ncbi:MAG: hypothetical protein ACI835_005834 [Planctomycetota bacterium]
MTYATQTPWSEPGARADGDDRTVAAACGALTCACLFPPHVVVVEAIDTSGDAYSKTVPRVCRAEKAAGKGIRWGAVHLCPRQKPVPSGPGSALSEVHIVFFRERLRTLRNAAGAATYTGVSPENQREACRYLMCLRHSSKHDCSRGRSPNPRTCVCWSMDFTRRTLPLAGLLWIAAGCGSDPAPRTDRDVYAPRTQAISTVNSDASSIEAQNPTASSAARTVANTPINSARTELDRVVPSKYETATFALG